MQYNSMPNIQPALTHIIQQVDLGYMLFELPQLLLQVDKMVVNPMSIVV